MSNQLKIVLFCSLAAAAASSPSDPIKEKTNLGATILVQATNFTSVPSVTYIVNAVQCLQEAYSIYDNDEDRATLYAALFEEKHNGTWNVLVGYTAVYLHSDIYIETAISDGGENKKKVSPEKLFLIFSTN